MNADEDTASELDDLPCPSPKRRKLQEDDSGGAERSFDVVQRAISPPPLKRPPGVRQISISPTKVETRYVSPPVQLTHIRGAPLSNNIDTISLTDILRDPIIKETWQFNFLFDVDFLMSAMDEDVRNLVQVNIVHGFWKKEDPSRSSLLEAASTYENVNLITAHMPEIFGTHHSKMMINFRHDNTAEVVIHTANMIERDWANLTQAVWRSPRLSMLPTPTESIPSESGGSGVGQRFKAHLLQYLGAYEGRTTSLVAELEKYDFSSVKAALVASVPGKHPRPPSSMTKTPRMSWGLQGLREILRKVPSSTPASQRPKVVVQVSSIASLRPLDGWFDAFRSVLSTTSDAVKTQPILRIIFPTAGEVRRSLDGYAAGASIHTKIKGTNQQKQLDYLRPMLCYWAGDGERPTSVAQLSSTAPATLVQHREAGRRRAAPHIKTYVRFADDEMTRIDWAMVTSANLSLQAWGALPDKDGKVRISSYEIGVVIWPRLFADDEEVQIAGFNETDSTSQKAARQDGEPAEKTATTGKTEKRRSIMVPIFKKNSLSPNQEIPDDVTTVVGFRMPYDLPLIRYAPDEEPWCASSTYSEPDWRGATWTHDHDDD